MLNNRIAQFTCKVIHNSRLISCQLPISHYSSGTVAKKTQEQDPGLHTKDQVSLLYTIPEKEASKLFNYGGYPKAFKKNVITFSETALMIREPALEIINYLKTSDFNQPAVRYVLYGKKGCGKSISLLHILHYAHHHKFYILHVPWAWDWFRNNRTEVAVSPMVPDLYDLPVLSASWLKHFESQNSQLLSEDTIKTSQDYVWNQRETTPAGSKISDLVIHGINRVKYAGGCVDAIIKELKIASTQNKCKVLVAIDGINCLFGKESNYKTEDKVKVRPSMVTLTHSFLEATKQDWKNAAIVLTIDQRAGREHELASHLPIYLLGRSGFEHLDPFVGVHVREYSDTEFHSILDYYEDRKWIQRKCGRGELGFLSNNNPFQIMCLSNPL